MEYHSSLSMTRLSSSTVLVLGVVNGMTWEDAMEFDTYLT